MAELALVLWAVFGVVAFVLRVVIHRRRTGASGLVGVSGRPWSAEWVAGAGFVAALAIGIAGPVLDLAGVLSPLTPLASSGTLAVGLALYAVGLLVTAAAQAGMGTSWRIGVDPEAATRLVTGGLFRLVRNPIFSGMIAAVAGIAVVAANLVAIAAWVLLVAAIELQVRRVEEPYLRRTHGLAYTAYAQRVGRLVPGIGKIRR